jgi:hypothetical protein
VPGALIGGSLEARPDGLLFQCDLSGSVIQCGIFEPALRDLMEFQSADDGEDEILRAVLSEIERIVRAKYEAGRFEDNGRLMIWPADLLRYGYWRRREVGGLIGQRTALRSNRDLLCRLLHEVDCAIGA